jgi:quercetin dioxygenase-like cupin family protein
MNPQGIEPDVRHDLFGGTGAVKVYNLARAPIPPFTAALWCELDPGGSVGRHRQDHFPEIVIGIEGDGEATVGDQAHPLVPGSVVHLPLGSVLSLRNNDGQAPLRYLIIKAQG